MPSFKGAIARLNAMKPRANVTVGRGCWLDPRAKLMGGDVVLDDKVTIFRGAEILGPVTIGEGSFLNRDAYVRPNVTIGKRVDIGAFARLVTDSHEVGGPDRRAGSPIFGEIRIEDGAWIGVGVTILGGVTPEPEQSSPPAAS